VKQYLCREEFLAEGARLMRRCMRPEASDADREALAAWQRRDKLSDDERRAVLRMAKTTPRAALGA
jgi:hypothetical protein